METNNNQIDLSGIAQLIAAGVSVADALTIAKGGTTDDLIKNASISSKRLASLPLFLDTTEGLTDEEKQTVLQQLVISKIALVRRTNNKGKDSEYFHCLVCPRVGGNSIEANYTVFSNQSIFYELMEYWSELTEEQSKRLKELTEMQANIITTPLATLQESLERKEKTFALHTEKGRDEKAKEVMKEIEMLREQIANYNDLSQPMDQADINELNELKNKNRKPLILKQADFENDNWQKIRYPFVSCKKIISGEILYKETIQTNQGLERATLIKLKGETKQSAIERHIEFRNGQQI